MIHVYICRQPSPVWRFLGFLTLALAVTASNAAAGSLRASVVKIDITPDKSQWLLGYGPRQSTGVHDHLFHRIVAMDDGKTQFFLVSTDLAWFRPPFMTTWREIFKRNWASSLSRSGGQRRIRIPPPR